MKKTVEILFILMALITNLIGQTNIKGKVTDGTFGVEYARISLLDSTASLYSNIE